MIRRVVGVGLVVAVAIGMMAASQAVAGKAPAPVRISAQLTPAEKDGLLFMREEEKLARDVYTALYARWGTPVFARIAASEQVHMDSILTLLNRYGLPDPAKGKAPGEFTNPVFQAMYADLVSAGSASFTEALRVGVFIEQADIADLTARLEQTVKFDIVTVYTNLRAASENHLAAFTSLLPK